MLDAICDDYTPRDAGVGGEGATEALSVHNPDVTNKTGTVGLGDVLRYTVLVGLSNPSYRAKYSVVHRVRIAIC